MRILLLTTGGTIDAAPYPEDGSPIPPDVVVAVESRACALFKTISPDADCIALCAKDSKEITPGDITRLAQAIESAEGYTRILVTMGTDRMPEIARAIKARNLPLSCPVVFTGAFMPLANGASSDGAENLRKAAFERPDLPIGIYIAAGDVFGDPDIIYKDFDRRIFVVRQEP